MQRILMTVVFFMVDQFGFHNSEKRLDHNVVPAAFLARHALGESVLSEFFARILTCILDAAIRMKDKAVSQPTVPYGPLHCCDHHLMAQRAAQRPADNQTREQIDDDRQLQPTLTGGQNVISDTHTLSGASAVKSISNRFGATGKWCLLSVVTR